MNCISDEANAGGATPSAAANRDDTVRNTQVWDVTIRLFHWLLVVAFVITWMTGDDFEDLHQIAGYLIVGLLVVRVVWGFAGTCHARFSDFVYPTSVIASYLVDMARFRAKRYLGHNPAGGVMVIALLVLLIATSATGIMMTTDAYWGFKWVEEAHEIAANLTVVLIGLHLVGVLAASVQHRENLLTAMITGRKRRE